MKVVSFLFCLASFYSFTQEVKQVSIGTKSTGTGEISLELIARKQSYSQRTEKILTMPMKQLLIHRSQ